MGEFIGRLIERFSLVWLVEWSVWVWPVCEVLHFVGMALLIGAVGLLDLRLLGVAKGLPVNQVKKFVPWGVFGFVLNVLTGIVFIWGDPNVDPIARFTGNLAFQLKMLFMALAGGNVLAFYLTGVSRATDELGPGDNARLSAKAIAVLSLFLWIGVIYFGRMIMYDDDLRLHEFFFASPDF